MKHVCIQAAAYHQLPVYQEGTVQDVRDDRLLQTLAAHDQAFDEFCDGAAVAQLQGRQRNNSDSSITHRSKL